MNNAAVQAISIRQLVIFLGAVFALGSLGIDSMLPSLGVIARELNLNNVNQAQLVVTSFAAGMGLGSLLGGPLSDHHGRRPIILTGCLLYVAGALCAMGAHSLTIVFIARVIQGIGASFTTVASTAWIRDMHAGPAMARIMSFAMTLFAMIPAPNDSVSRSTRDSVSAKRWNTIGSYSGRCQVWTNLLCRYSSVFPERPC